MIRERKWPDAKSALRRKSGASGFFIEGLVAARKIDALVYELYGLTDEEINIGESS